MPPKRKAKAPAAATPAKKAKASKAEEEPPATLKDKIAKLKELDKGKVKKFKPDALFPYASSSTVWEDYDAMLNQTNIGRNNNKYYIIQVLKDASGGYFAWNRWGRVGENGAKNMDGPHSTVEPAIKSFEKKFRDKTRNPWANRASFQAVKGKYTLLEMAGEDDDEEEEETVVITTPDAPSVPVKTAASKLDKASQGLMKLIFDNDMFKETLQKFDIDVKKMPLGKLSKSQIAKGFEALEALELAIEKGQRPKFVELTSKFYTIIPHSFGRTVPPTLSTIEAVQQKYDMLAVLGDIEIAQSMQKSQPKAAAGGGTVPHPLDANLKLLDCDLEVLDHTSHEYKTLEKNYNNTKNNGGWRNLKKLCDIWKVNRHSEGAKFAANNKIAYRKLLWHGTSVAVVSAILKTGLRIMPHSGGRVGKGIYFASENEKSAGYVGPAQGKVIMFLNEVALGNMNRILNDDSSLKKAPTGYDSVLACGQQEPDEKFDVTLKIEGKDVIVPTGKAKKIPEYSRSSFYNSEYLVYREDQARIRYLLLFDC